MLADPEPPASSRGVTGVRPAPLALRKLDPVLPGNPGSAAIRAGEAGSKGAVPRGQGANCPRESFSNSVRHRRLGGANTGETPLPHYATGCSDEAQDGSKVPRLNNSHPGGKRQYRCAKGTVKRRTGLLSLAGQSPRWRGWLNRGCTRFESMGLKVAEKSSQQLFSRMQACGRLSWLFGADNYRLHGLGCCEPTAYIEFSCRPIPHWTVP